MANYQIRKFVGEIDAWIKHAETAVETATEIFIRDVHSALVMASPVDTGRFRGNWQITFNEVPLHALARYDKSGSSTIREEQSKTYGMFSRGGAVTSVHFSNMLIYANALEYGHSQQAPAGVLGIVAIRLRSYYANAVRKARSV